MSNGEAEPFDGLNVVDLTEGFAGALCTGMLGDHGAAVVRVIAAEEDSRDDSAQAAGARAWHRSKSIVAFADADLDRLIAEADIIVTTPHGWVGANTPAAGALAARNSWAIVAEITGFGENLLYRNTPAYEGLAMAVAGRMVDYGRTYRRDRPVIVAPPLAGYGAAQAALHGISAALLVRASSGRGQIVRTSMTRAISPFDFWGPGGSTSTVVPPASPTPLLGYTPARAKDGVWIQYANWAPHLLWHLLEVLGLGYLKDDEEFRTLPVVSNAAGHKVWELILQATATKDSEEWMQVFRTGGTAGGDLLGPTTNGLDHPQLRHNGDVVTVDGAEQLAPVPRWDKPSPPLGPKQWATPRRTAPTASRAAAPRKPLEGLVLLEAATMIATPVGALALADLGARVIKIEPLEGEAGRAMPFHKTFWGKESISLDMKHPEALAIVHQLVARADMFLHNYRPGVPKRLGIDYATLSAINERLVYVYSGAYGIDGPSAKQPGYHPIAGAVCGNAVAQAGRGALATTSADLDELKRQSLHLYNSNEGHPDPVTGLVAASALLFGLLDRQRTGRGREINLSMLSANALLMSANFIRFACQPAAAEVDAELNGTSAINRLYPTREGWVFVAAPFDRDFRLVCEVLGLPALPDDARFNTPLARAANDDALAALFGAALAGTTADAIEGAALRTGAGIVRADRHSMATYQQAEIAAGRLSNACKVENPEGGEQWRAAAMVEMEGVGQQGPRCLAGQHTVPILRELGYDDDAIDGLLARDVVWTKG